MAPGIGSSMLTTTTTAAQELLQSSNDASHINGSIPSTLVHHTLITSDSDALKFHAAASLQLLHSGRKQHASKVNNNPDENNNNKLIVSPYNDLPHLLDLKTLDTPNQLFAKALTIFKPIRADYATAPYSESFNWDAVFAFLRDLSVAEGYSWPTKQSFYVVVFRSILFSDVDIDRLSELDAHSHREATSSGGLLKYWFGSTNENRQNLATCIWRSKTDAKLGGTGPWHKQARGAAQDMYERITFTTLKLVVYDGVSSWSIDDWTTGDE